MKHFTFGVLFCLLIVSLSGCMSSMKIIAHRGASYLAPENTMVSVMLAWEKSADAVEIDVQLSKDDRIVVIHDASTKRTAGVDMKVGETTSEKLRKLDVGHFKGEKFVGERIPFLEEIIKTIPPERKLCIEIKDGKKILSILQQIITESGKMSQIAIAGFDLETMAMSKKIMPEIPTYWLRGTIKNEKTGKWFPYDTKLIQMVKEKGLDGISVFYAGVTKDFVDEVKTSGQELYVWVVNDPKEAICMDKLQINGVATNRPGWLREQLQHYEK